MDEKESLDIILNMVNKAKSNINENGGSAILWGIVIAICSFFTYFQIQNNWDLGGFNIWYLTFVAAIYQVVKVRKDACENTVKTHNQDAINAIWNIYFIAIMALIFYLSFVPNHVDSTLAGMHKQIVMKDLTNNSYTEYGSQVPSFASLMLILYFIPTLFTGMIAKFKPMIYGGIIMIVFFAISCFTPTATDFLLEGFASIFGWLIPGIILFKRYKKANV